MIMVLLAALSAATKKPRPETAVWVGVGEKNRSQPGARFGEAEIISAARKADKSQAVLVHGRATLPDGDAASIAHSPAALTGMRPNPRLPGIN